VFFKSHSPIKGLNLTFTPCVCVQIVYDIATTDD
jgi:hypothetical protein